MYKLLTGITGIILLGGCAQKSIDGAQYARNAVVEASIGSVQADVLLGRMKCLDVVNAYIERIEIYDQSTTLNAITYKNFDEARTEANLIDSALAEGRSLPSLFCVPVLVKDNMDVQGFPTTAGSKMLMDNMPPDDANVIAKLKEQGAIVLAKTNMAEWAFSPRQTKSTSAGITKNAYNLDHVPAGSSGGTASGIAASFALVGLGTDTGNSVRGPSSHLALVGMRSTHGLLDLDGIVPLVLTGDVVGPMTRTVSDNVIMYAAMGGENYVDELDENGLKGKRLAIVRELATDMDKDIADLFGVAVNDLRGKGATVIDTIIINDIDAHINASWGCKSFRKDVHEYLTQPGMNAIISDPFEAFAAGVYAPYTAKSWGYFKGGAIDVATKADGTVCGNLLKDVMRQNIKKDILAAMERENLDALIYPSWRYPAARLDRAEQDYKGDNSQTLAPPTGLPAITVPMGFTVGDLPAGLQILGRPNSEGNLYKLAYAYEQATKHRRAPANFPTIRK
ncbi:MAG: glutamyl-tRNA amidotransferase [Robiginitomaculum sp.]|nr:MAG: glutamyl-tRNA amidotransferase [Robiginitomaculum sp.]